MQHTGLADLLQNILRDAGEAHHTLIASMEKTRDLIEYNGVDPVREKKTLKRFADQQLAIDSENRYWHRFYAEYVAHRLTPYLCGMQCDHPKRKPEPPLPLLATVQGKWDTTTASKDAIRLGVANCHDTGECQGYGE